MGWICKVMAWAQARRMSALTLAFNQGYDWAAGALLRGQETPASLAVHIDSSYEFPQSPHARSFDRGAVAACNRLIYAGVIHDDTHVARPNPTP